jgi:hypothetical protein
MNGLRDGGAGLAGVWARAHAALGLATITDTWRRGMAIAAASVAVLRDHPRLLVPPLAAAVAVMTILCAFVPFALFVPAVPSGLLPFVNEGSWTALLAAYLACVTIVIVADAALIAGALAALSGAPVSLVGSIATAARQLPQIIAWSVLAATVGVVARTVGCAGAKAMERNAGGTSGGESAVIVVVAIIVGGLSLLWTGTYFVLPVLLAETLGPIAAVRRSAALLQARWPNAVVTAARFGLFNFVLLTVPLAVVMIATANVPMSDAATARLIAGCVAYFAVLQIILSALGAVFVAAVYRFAITRTVPAPFAAELVETAFRAPS